MSRSSFNLLVALSGKMRMEYETRKGECEMLTEPGVVDCARKKIHRFGIAMEIRRRRIVFTFSRAPNLINLNDVTQAGLKETTIVSIFDAK